MRSQGPAVTLKITNRNGREYSIDLTLAIKHESWSECAEEWRRRRRNGIVEFAIIIDTHQKNHGLYMQNCIGYTHTSRFLAGKFQTITELNCIQSIQDQRLKKPSHLYLGH